jgi:hypothetical protein
MRKAVVVMPGLIMLIRNVARDKLFHETRDVLQQTRLVLDRADRRRGADRRHTAYSLFDLRGAHDPGYVIGDIVDATKAPCLDPDFISINRHNACSKSYNMMNLSRGQVMRSNPIYYKRMLRIRLFPLLAAPEGDAGVGQDPCGLDKPAQSLINHFVRKISYEDKL